MSCQKFVKISNPKNEITTNVVFSDSADATSAVLGIYINIMQNTFSASNTPLNGGITINTSLSSDELYPSNLNGSDLEFYINAISPISNSTTDNFWAAFYQTIYQANACIEGLNNNNNISTSLRNQLQGEAKVVRSICYFNLINLFGDVPLIVSTDYANNSILSRTKTDTIYQHIISDLLEASNQLSPNYQTLSSPTRPNMYSALALLARVYLYNKQWAQADSISSRIISSGKYLLEGDLARVFISESSETIWALVPLQQGYETAEGYTFIPSDPTILPQYIISKELLESFDSLDQRRANWLDSNIVNGQTYYYPYKYKLGYDANSNPIENLVVFRLGEQYLIRAEARAQLGDYPGALADLNVIRSRAGLPLSTESDFGSISASIKKERRNELFCEWGNRWYDLKRTNDIDSVMTIEAAIKGGQWHDYSKLYPIPFIEIQSNPRLIQNSGY